MQPNPALNRLTPAHILGAALAALILLRLFSALFSGAGAAAGIPAGPVAGEENLNQDILPVWQVAWLLIAQNVILLAVLLSLLRIGGIPIAALGLRAISARTAWREIAFALLLIPFFAALNLLLLLLYVQLFGTPVESSQLPLLLSGRSTPLADSLFFLAAVLIAPIVEELIFRGLLFSWMQTKTTIKLAATVSATVFAIVHLPPAIIPLMFVFGLIMARRFTITNSLWAPILVHITFNGVNVWLFYTLRDIFAENEGFATPPTSLLTPFLTPLLSALS